MARSFKVQLIVFDVYIYAVKMLPKIWCYLYMFYWGMLALFIWYFIKLGSEIDTFDVKKLANLTLIRPEDQGR